MRNTAGTPREFYSVPVTLTRDVKDKGWTPGRKAGPPEKDPLDGLPPKLAARAILARVLSGRGATLMGEDDDE